MFEKEADKRCSKYFRENCYNKNKWADTNDLENMWQDGAEFGYNKGKEELTERLDNATEIIELMKDLFFDCWQEKGFKAIKFEQRVNDFLKGE